MSVFHYLAEVLKDEPLFDNKIEDSLETGAVYNDFDSTPDSFMETKETESFSFSQSSPIKKGPDASETLVTFTSAVDTAVMSADKAHGVLYEELVWDSPNFDNVSETCNEEYCKKVHNLLTNHDGAWDSLTITEKAEKMFERRMRTDWSLPDTVYDAWILRKGRERSWFDLHLFSNMFPDFENEMSKETSEAMQKSDDDDNDDIEIIPAKRRKTGLPRLLFSSSESEEELPEKNKDFGQTDVSAEDSKDSIKFVVSHPTVAGEIIIISDDE